MKVVEPVETPLTLKDLTDAMTRSSTGVTKVSNVPENVGMKPTLALLTQINLTIQQKGLK